jgi:hypothetical protein
MAGKTPGTFAEYLREIAPDLDRAGAANDAMPDDSEWPAHPYEW